MGPRCAPPGRPAPPHDAAGAPRSAAGAAVRGGDRPRCARIVDAEGAGLGAGRACQLAAKAFTVWWPGSAGLRALGQEGAPFRSAWHVWGSQGSGESSYLPGGAAQAGPLTGPASAPELFSAGRARSAVPSSSLSAPSAQGAAAPEAAAAAYLPFWNAGKAFPWFGRQSAAPQPVAKSHERSGPAGGSATDVAGGTVPYDTYIEGEQYGDEHDYESDASGQAGGVSSSKAWSDHAGATAQLHPLPASRQSRPSRESPQQYGKSAQSVRGVPPVIAAGVAHHAPSTGLEVRGKGQAARSADMLTSLSPQQPGAGSQKLPGGARPNTGRVQPQQKWDQSASGQWQSGHASSAGKEDYEDYSSPADTGVVASALPGSSQGSAVVGPRGPGDPKRHPEEHVSSDPREYAQHREQDTVLPAAAMYPSKQVGSPGTRFGGSQPRSDQMDDSRVSEADSFGDDAHQGQGWDEEAYSSSGASSAEPRQQQHGYFSGERLHQQTEPAGQQRGHNPWQGPSSRRGPNPSDVAAGNEALSQPTPQKKSSSRCCRTAQAL